jgi:hypothetical protein
MTPTRRPHRKTNHTPLPMPKPITDVRAYNQEAESILSQFHDAIKIAVSDFRHSYGDWLTTDEAFAFSQERVLIYAGLLASDHVRSDSDFGALARWQEWIATNDRDVPVKANPERRLRGSVVHALRMDLIGAVRTPIARAKKHPMISLDSLLEANPSFDVADIGCGY